MLPGLSEERPLQVLEARLQDLEVLSQVQPEIQRDLIVPAPTCVELPSHRTHDLRQPTLHRHVYVLIRIRERETVFTKFVPDPFESTHQGATFRAGQDSGFFQGLAMGKTAKDVVFEQPAIKGQGARKAFDQCMGRFGEPAGPGF